MRSRDVFLQPILFGMTLGLGILTASLFDPQPAAAIDAGCVDRSVQSFGQASGSAEDRVQGFPDAILYDSPSATSGTADAMEIISKPRASYTEAARLNKVEGAVMLRITFMASGEIGKVEVLRGLPYGLTEKAVDAAKEIKFRPKMINGKPVTTTMTFQYGFNIY